MAKVNVTAVKEGLRRRHHPPVFNPGLLAEKLRALPGYKGCRRIFAGLSPQLVQIRINTLLDGKELLMPAPGLRDGFYLLPPFTTPFAQLPQAVTSRGMSRFGRKLTGSQLAGLGVDLLVDQALAVDRRGVILGDGQGFFDLAAAILATVGALAPAYRVVAVGAGVEAEEFAADPWDLQADYLLNDQGLKSYPRPEPPAPPRIFWEALSPTRIKRVTPLWQLRNPS